MSRIDIKSNGTGAYTHVFIDGKEIKGLKSIEYKSSAGECNIVIMTFENVEVNVDDEDTLIIKLNDEDASIF